MNAFPVTEDHRTATYGVPAQLSRHLKIATLFTPEYPLVLESGRSLSHVQVAYEEYGTPSRHRDNTVFVCHALTGDSHPARHDPDDIPGWWDVMVGPGRPIDTDTFHVVSANVLGGCAGTTGPLSPGETGRPLGPDFPEVTVADMVTVHRALLAHLGVDRLHSVVGGSLGGMQALEWLLRHPGDARRFVLIGTAAGLTTDGLAAHAVSRAAIRSDPCFDGGRYVDDLIGPGPRDGLGIARMVAHLTYMSPESLESKFGRAVQPGREPTGPAHGRYAIERYLEHQARKFVDRFDANSYLHLTTAMDRFTAFERPHAIAAENDPAVHVFSFASDRLFGQEVTNALLAQLTATGLTTVTHHRDSTSPAGHDAFLLNVPGYLREMRAVLAAPSAA
ncbi:homoserine O-acetyltransferase [Streptomyces sp. WAC 01529]|uniref:homoserine O-acetyltransferase MetX n=1 Tax=Streptomyces sp. WAC 01529 TaxID=2203205 RepID=UPI0019D268A9|nr:homoserine O-acetyltransferase [Streptomyces sp. WAC 01529]